MFQFRVLDVTNYFNFNPFLRSQKPRKWLPTNTFHRGQLCLISKRTLLSCKEIMMFIHLNHCNFWGIVREWCELWFAKFKELNLSICVTFNYCKITTQIYLSKSWFLKFSHHFTGDSTHSLTPINKDEFNFQFSCFSLFLQVMIPVRKAPSRPVPNNEHNEKCFILSSTAIILNKKIKLFVKAERG